MLETGEESNFKIVSDLRRCCRIIRIRSFTFLDKESGIGYGQTSVYDLQDVKGDGK